VRTALIDGDLFLYQAASANEQSIQWDADTWTLSASFEAARTNFDSFVDHIAKELECEKVVVALSNYDQPWRKQVMPDYKRSRGETRKPLCWKPLREYIHETRKVYERPSLEGDDVLGILATSKLIIEGDKIVVSQDKDMKTLPGLHLDDRRARQAMAAKTAKTYLDCVRVIAPHEADYNHLLQTLTGDSTDGYPGCPGIGPKKAAVILEPHLSRDPDGLITYLHGAGAWQAIVETYAKKKLGPEVALMNARVARICRYTDYNFQMKEVRLWNPPVATTPAP
jgi:DNA polymerase-1